MEALNLFEEICNSRWFRETSMTLFLNKRDLFAEKCTKVSLSLCFPDFTGDDSYEAGAHFIQEQFETNEHAVKPRPIDPPSALAPHWN